MFTLIGSLILIFKELSSREAKDLNYAEVFFICQEIPQKKYLRAILQLLERTQAALGGLLRFPSIHTHLTSLQSMASICIELAPPASASKRRLKLPPM